MLRSTDVIVSRCRTCFQCRDTKCSQLFLTSMRSLSIATENEVCETRGALPTLLRNRWNNAPTAYVLPG